MSHLTGAQRSQYVRSMFARIAGHYDLINRLMTAGQDSRWRREVIRKAALHPTDRLLDLGAGTGDLTFEALRQNPKIRPLPADFTFEMMQVGKKRPRGSALPWVGADALHLPFPPQSFDAVISGFLMRNVADLPQALAEQHRVLKPGGRIVILDTTPPPQNWLSPLIRFHLHRVIPTLGRLIARDVAAYAYLPDSTEHFLTAEALAKHLQTAGFRQVSFQRYMVGTVAIHSAVK